VIFLRMRLRYVERFEVGWGRGVTRINGKGRGDIYRVSTLKRPDFIIQSVLKESP
jgi:hypothetical protein